MSSHETNGKADLISDEILADWPAPVAREIRDWRAWGRAIWLDMAGDDQSRYDEILRKHEPALQRLLPEHAIPPHA